MSTLTGAHILIFVASESGNVFSYASPNFVYLQSNPRIQEIVSFCAKNSEYDIKEKIDAEYGNDSGEETPHEILSEEDKEEEEEFVLCEHCEGDINNKDDDRVPISHISNKCYSCGIRVPLCCAKDGNVCDNCSKIVQVSDDEEDVEEEEEDSIPIQETAKHKQPPHKKQKI